MAGREFPRAVFFKGKCLQGRAGKILALCRQVSGDILGELKSDQHKTILRASQCERQWWVSCRRRSLRYGARGGVWFLDATELDQQLPEPVPANADTRRQQLAAAVASGQFTPPELATLRALVIERLTIEEIAQRDGCSRQAVMARLTGNSRGQGGILKKARSLLPYAPLTE